MNLAMDTAALTYIPDIPMFLNGDLPEDLKHELTAGKQTPANGDPANANSS